MDYFRRLQDAQETLVLVTDRYNTVMQEAKEQLLKAKALSNGFTPANEGFDVFREGYNSLGGKLFEYFSHVCLLIRDLKFL